MLCINDVDFWVRVGQVITALFAIGVAYYAASSWRRNLKDQAKDKCISTIYEVRGLIGRFLDLRRMDFGEGLHHPPYDEAWNSYRGFRAAHAVMSRYRDMTDIDPEQVPTILMKLRQDAKWTAEEAREAIKVYSEMVRDKLK